MAEARLQHLRTLVTFFVSGSTVLAGGLPSTYFGEDLNGSEETRLTAHPNADLAREEFHAALALWLNGTEDFELVPAESSPPFAILTGPLQAALTGNGTVISQPTGTNGSGRYPVSGNQYFETNGPFTLAMVGEPAYAVGFYCVDAGDGGVRLTLTLSLVSGGTLEVMVPNNIDPLVDSQGAVLYFGLLSAQPFTSVTISSTAPQLDVLGFDDLTVANSPTVPTVSEWGLIAMGLLTVAAGTVVVMRRRRVVDA